MGLINTGNIWSKKKKQEQWIVLGVEGKIVMFLTLAIESIIPCRDSKTAVKATHSHWDLTSPVRTVPQTTPSLSTGKFFSVQRVSRDVRSRNWALYCVFKRLRFGEKVLGERRERVSIRTVQKCIERLGCTERGKPRRIYSLLLTPLRFLFLFFFPPRHKRTRLVVTSEIWASLKCIKIYGAYYWTAT